MIRKIIIVVTFIFSLLLCFGCNKNHMPKYEHLYKHDISLTGIKANAIEFYEAYTYADNNKILVLALVASIFSSMLLFYQLMQKHKKERLLDTYAAETRLSRKVHDEIANEIYGTLHFIESEEIISGVKKQKLISKLDNIYLLTRNISRENNDIDIGLRFSVQLKLMLASYGNENVSVIVKGLSKIEWQKVEPTKKIALYRVLQELMVNMHKHSKATVVLIDFSHERKKIKVIYSDNGIGISCNTLKLKNGLQNVENRMVSIGGTITFDTKAEKGFHLELNFTGQ